MTLVLVAGMSLMGAVDATPVAAEASWMPLRDLAKPRPIQVGTAIKHQALEKDPAYAAMLIREYDLVTPENALKWAVLRPGRVAFDFGRADVLVNFAITNNLQIRGHTLCWNLDQHLPPWLLEGRYTPKESRRLLRRHVQAVVGRYKGRVACWDVVNEAVSNDPRKPLLADGFWKRSLGPDYIDLAFQWAHAADPQALLFYNDYDVGDPMGTKSDRIYELVRGLVQRQVPIHGVGLQMHCRLSQPPDEDSLRANIARLTRLGLQVHITELDVGLEGGSGPLTEQLEQQAGVYATVTRAAMDNPQCTALVTWGFTDKWGNTHRNKRLGKPTGTPTHLLPFDREYRPKPAAWAIAKALKGEAR